MLVSRLAMAAVSRFVQRFQTGIVYKDVDQVDELEQIFCLNHDTFTREVEQHTPRPDGRLVDKFHDRNHYIVAKVGDEVVGMCCVTMPGEGGFSIEKKLTDPTVIEPYLGCSVELRLLIVKKPYRKLGLYLGLAEKIWDYCATLPWCEYALLSAVRGREGIYARYGFEPIDVPKRIGKVEFIPMALSRARFEGADPLRLRG